MARTAQRQTSPRAELRRRWRLLRAAAGLSQVAVEVDAQLPRGKQFRIEHGLDEPSADERARIARVLGVKVDDVPAGLASIAPERAAS